MGDRVLIQVVNSAAPKKNKAYSPVIYGHSAGSNAAGACKRLKERMKDRPGDVEYTAARALQELMGSSEGSHGFGVWNATHVLTDGDSHGDAGVILIDVANGGFTFQCLGGYLELDTDGLPCEPSRAE